MSDKKDNSKLLKILGLTPNDIATLPLKEIFRKQADAMQTKMKLANRVVVSLFAKAIYAKFSNPSDADLDELSDHIKKAIEEGRESYKKLSEQQKNKTDDVILNDYRKTVDFTREIISELKPEYREAFNEAMLNILPKGFLEICNELFKYGYGVELNVQNMNIIQEEVLKLTTDEMVDKYGEKFLNIPRDQITDAVEEMLLKMDRVSLKKSLSHLKEHFNSKDFSKLCVSGFLSYDAILKSSRKDNFPNVDNPKHLKSYVTHLSKFLGVIEDSLVKGDIKPDTCLKTAIRKCG